MIAAKWSNSPLHVYVVNCELHTLSIVCDYELFCSERNNDIFALIMDTRKSCLFSVNILIDWFVCFKNMNDYFFQNSIIITGKLMAYNSTDNTVDIYYVDYGDSCWVEFTNQNLQLLRYFCAVCLCLFPVIVWTTVSYFVCVKSETG